MTAVQGAPPRADRAMSAAGVALSVALTLLAACVPTPRPAPPSGAGLGVASYFRGVPALAGLTAVRLGMSRRDLERARPRGVADPYGNFTEVLGRDTVRYLFPYGAAAGTLADILHDRRPPDPTSRLVGVEVVSWFPASAAAAESTWRARAREVRGGRAGAVQCFAYRYQAATLARVILRRGDPTGDSSIVVGVTILPPHSLLSAGAAERRPAYVRTYVVTDLRRVVPSAQPRHDIECPT